MSEIDNDTDLVVPDEMATLKARADLLGVKFHPSISLEKLREKVGAAVEEPAEKSVEVAQVNEETLAQRRMRKKREANELVRIRVTCMNPAKKEWEGEIFTAGNSLVGSFSKYVPFNDAEDGWHVPRILYNMIVERQCQIFVTSRDTRGNSSRKGKIIKEFAVEVMPSLTTAELTTLARKQSMAKATD